MNSEITKLPDGSAFFTADVMSKDEAMALPLKERPLCFRISSELYHAVFEDIGVASTGVCPEHAAEISTKLCFKIANAVEDGTAQSSAK